MKNIVLIGYQGVGKTFYGRMLAQECNMNFVDTDEILEREFKEGIKGVYKRLGEREFRNEEKRVIEGLHGIANTVIATGGGVVEIEEAQKVLQDLGVVVYIYNCLEVLKQRRPDQGNFYNGINIEKVFERRCKLYEKCCNNKVEGTWDQILSVGSLR